MSKEHFGITLYCCGEGTIDILTVHDTYEEAKDILNQTVKEDYDCWYSGEDELWEELLEAKIPFDKNIVKGMLEKEGHYLDNLNEIVEFYKKKDKDVAEQIKNFIIATKNNIFDDIWDNGINLVNGDKYRMSSFFC
jgi:hypothetical protein